MILFDNCGPREEEEEEGVEEEEAGAGLDSGMEEKEEAISCWRQPTPFSYSWSMCTP